PAGRLVARLPGADRSACPGVARRNVRHSLGQYDGTNGARDSGRGGGHGSTDRPYPDARGAGCALGDRAAIGKSGMSNKRTTPRILHVHSTFDAGGKEVRCARLINAFGRDAEHAIVVGDPAHRSAAALLAKGVKVTWPAFPSLVGKPLPCGFSRPAGGRAGYDFICTYSGGAMDAVMADTLLVAVYDLPALVYHADGFNADEAG